MKILLVDYYKTCPVSLKIGLEGFRKAQERKIRKSLFILDKLAKDLVFYISFIMIYY